MNSEYVNVFFFVHFFSVFFAFLKCIPVTQVVSILIRPFSLQKLIGSPDDSSLGFLRSDNARRYMKQLPQYPRQDFRLRFRNMSAGAVDLLEKMLVFDPSRRITGTLTLHQLLHFCCLYCKLNIIFPCS